MPRGCATTIFILALIRCASEAAPRKSEGPIPPPTLAAAPTTPGPAPSGLALIVPPTPAEPVIQAGDMIEIRVYQQPDLDSAVRVPESGVISLPLIQQLEVAGRSTFVAEQLLKEKLSAGFVRNPHVIVTIREFAQRKVYVLGGVKSPGGYPLSPYERMTLLQLIAAAGGFNERGFKEHAQIVRRRAKGEREVIRLSILEVEKLVAQGKPEMDLELRADDLVIIPLGARVAHVLGAIRSPGPLELPVDNRTTVSMAISKVGGTSKFASTSKITVLRQTPGTGDTVKIPVDLDAILQQGRLDLDVELTPGDIVWVPERTLF